MPLCPKTASISNLPFSIKGITKPTIFVWLDHSDLPLSERAVDWGSGSQTFHQKQTKYSNLSGTLLWKRTTTTKKPTTARPSEVPVNKIKSHVLFWGVNFHIHIMLFFKKFEWRGKLNFLCGKWKTKRIAPCSLTNMSPRKNSKAITRGCTGYTEDWGHLKKNGGKRKWAHTQTHTHTLPPHPPTNPTQNSFLGGGGGEFSLQGFESANQPPDPKNQSEAIAGGRGRGALQTKQNKKKVGERPRFQVLVAKTYVNWSCLSCHDNEVAGGPKRTTEVRRVK